MTFKHQFFNKTNTKIRKQRKIYKQDISQKEDK